VIDVRVCRNENCYPMVRLAPATHQMVGLPKPSRLAIDTTRGGAAPVDRATVSAHLLLSPAVAPKL